MGKIIAIASQKGGVSKTTSAINICAGLASYNKRILLVDMDPSGNASRGFGFDTTLVETSIFDVLSNGLNINKAIVKTKIMNIDLLPSKFSLSSIEELRKNEEGQYLLLKEKILSIKDDYDYLIIDCPPSLGFLTCNCLAASNSVIIPFQCEAFAFESISQMLGLISNIQNEANIDLSIEGFLITMFDKKNKVNLEICSQIRSLFKENVFLTEIPRNTSIVESISLGMPVTSYRPNSIGALAFKSLAREIIDKNR